MENALFAQKNQMRAQKVTKSNSCMKLMEKGITNYPFSGNHRKSIAPNNWIPDKGWVNCTGCREITDSIHGCYFKQ